ncbi:MAG: GGDEF domain-containing protein, partial [Clostridia bacterium]|nr:GGDEF domain-containing protein [Deltaproteobacteria bacterium]
LSNIVTQNIRREDVFARYGGEEFSLILPEIELEGAAQVCEKLRMKIEEKQFVFAQKRIPVTVSLGIRTTRKDEKDTTSTEFLANADAKLYEAKEGGRNKVCY